MNPILIFEHIESSGPGLFKEFLKARSIPYKILRPNLGDGIPGYADISSYSGFCFCGGTESVTNPTDWMVAEIKLIQVARENDIPVIGHCLGGQLISKALGGDVIRHHLEEFGWSRLHIDNNHISKQWLSGVPTELVAMQWHSDTFTLPAGATRILIGDNCINQAFVHENMLAMQFHVEANIDTIKHWAIDLVEKHPITSNSVQTGKQIMQNLDKNFTISKHLATQFYTRWLEKVI
jgi:GMP synthase-like glutamine amidotransferase